MWFSCALQSEFQLAKDRLTERVVIFIFQLCSLPKKTSSERKTVTYLQQQCYFFGEGLLYTIYYCGKNGNKSYMLHLKMSVSEF